MNSDLLTAIIIAGVFFLSMIGIFVDAFIREWIAETKDRNFYVRKSITENPWVFAEVIPENECGKITAFPNDYRGVLFDTDDGYYAEV